MRFGLDAERIERLLGRQDLQPPEWEPIFERLAAPTGLTQNRSTFGRRDVLQALCETAGRGATVNDLERAADSFLHTSSVVRLIAASDRKTDALYSTAELLETERLALSTALALRKAGRGLAADHVVTAALAARPHLSDEQRVMVERLTQDGDGVTVVVGAAGTGKTTALAAAREAWEAAGLPVRGCAVARKAAHKLRRTADIEATSVAALLRRSQTFEPGTILVIDEASMLGTRAFAELVT